MFKNLKDVPVAGAFGVKYNAENNEFEGNAKNVARYAYARAPHKETKLPSQKYPKDMFSIEQRAKLVMQ
jgi:hypothetical protein